MTCSRKLLNFITQSRIKPVTIIECYERKDTLSRKCTVTIREVMVNNASKSYLHFVNRSGEIILEQ